MRFTKLVIVAGALCLVAAAHAEEPIRATLYKMPYCDCCEGHADHLRQHGFQVDVEEVDDLAALRSEAGLPRSLEGCHTIHVGDYVVEGHVSAGTIRRLLSERPQGIAGISMPGMPTGVPGMPGESEGPIEVFAFGDGEPTVFAVE